MLAPIERVPSSFRDPSGFVYRREGTLFRQVHTSYAGTYQSLKATRFYESLVVDGLMLGWEEVPLTFAADAHAACVLKPIPLRFVSHPYEWSFGMLRDAALLTLDLQRKALEAGYVLKDASAYNIQFHLGRPVLLDTLSFDPRQEDEPWIAYGQFCRHFLAPLALMSRVDIRLGSLLAEHLDGLPLDFVSRVLPGNTRLNFGLLAHLHLHSKSKGADTQKRPAKGSMSTTALLALTDSLERTIRSLKWDPQGTEWATYYQETNYQEESSKHKQQVVGGWLENLSKTCTTCWDLGANDGRYSMMAVQAGMWTLAADIDPAAVELAYRHTRNHQVSALHPLLVNLTNPPTGRGWMGAERQGLLDRGPADLAMALALVHHLAIGNNVPLRSVVEMLLKCGRHLILEWVPKEDSQVERMMVARKDVFNEYNQHRLEEALTSQAVVLDRVPVRGTKRVLYLVGPR